MSAFLVDTNVFLWFLFDKDRLSKKALQHLASSELHLSIASLWEITIKHQLGKLALGMSLERFFHEFITQRELEVEQVELRHLQAYSALPLHHRDPFDRLIIAQAQILNLPVIVSDRAFKKYSVKTLW